MIFPLMEFIGTVIVFEGNATVIARTVIDLFSALWVFLPLKRSFLLLFPIVFPLTVALILGFPSTGSHFSQSTPAAKRN